MHREAVSLGMCRGGAGGRSWGWHPPPVRAVAFAWSNPALESNRARSALGGGSPHASERGWVVRGRVAPGQYEITALPGFAKFTVIRA